MVGSEGRNFRAQWLLELRKSLPVPAARSPETRRSKPYPTQDEMVALLAARGVQFRDRTDYNKLETGRNALTDALAAEIAAAFGVPGPTPPAPPQSDIDRLIASHHDVADALRAQTKALDSLVLEMRGQVADAQGAGRAQGETLRQLIAALDPEGTRSAMLLARLLDGEPGTPHRSAGTSGR